MQGAQMGTRRASSGTAWTTVITVLIAIAGSYGGSSPNVPYNTAAPATGAPATGAPATGAPGMPNYP